MDYAIQLLFPILGGLLLGYWLSRHFGASPIWTVLLAILGMFAGLGILYKRFAQSSTNQIVHRKPPAPQEKSPPARSVEDLSFLYTENDDADEDFNKPDKDKESRSPGE